jgi:hypothetical protein
MIEEPAVTKRMTITEVTSLSTYMISVRLYLAEMMKDQGIVGVDEKADRQMVNKTYIVIDGWSAGESSRMMAKELADTIPVAWNRKKKVKA